MKVNDVDEIRGTVMYRPA